MDVIKVGDHWEFAGIKFAKESDALHCKIVDLELTLQTIAMRKWKNGHLVILAQKVLETGEFDERLTDLNKKERERLGIFDWEEDGQ